MNVGITSAGVYVPYYRMTRETVNTAWGVRGGKGEISVANTDEDSVTMAVEAALQCVKTIARQDIGSLYFASVTAPYAEKSQATLIAAACDLDSDLYTADFAHSTRAGSSALKAAIDAVKAGSVKQALVTAADTRTAYPKAPKELLLGDGAAALSIGAEHVIAEFVESVSVSNEIIDYWRNYGEKYVRTAEGRFALEEGYTAAMKQAVKALLKKANVTPDQIAKVALVSQGTKDNEKLAKSLGFQPEQVQSNLMDVVGDTGCAQGLMLLAAALEEAKPGDLVLVAAYGNGTDAMLFKATDNIDNFAAEQRVSKALNTKRYLTSYARFLSFKESIQTVPGEPFRTFPSNAAYWRDRKSILSFRGSVCKKCGQGMFPMNRVCCKCGSADEYEEVRFAERPAKVFSFSIDNLAGRSDDPVVVQTSVEDMFGVRYYMLMTDFEKNEIQIGTDVEFTFRKIYEGGNYINYYWKCRPVHTQEEVNV